MLRQTVVGFMGCLVLAGPVLADELPAGCDKFSWDLSKELSLFSAPAAASGTALSAATNAARAPAVTVGKLYAVSLQDQAKVKFEHSPGKSRLPDGAHGGLLRVKVNTAGKYRVTIDKGSWVDVAADGALVNSNQFQGRTACPVFHKSVEYTFPANKALLIQLSGETDTTVRLAVTPVPVTPAP
ncbi:MAG: hypothetical protein U1F35_10390 [Steroidobacteraceae bacterium]